MQNRRLKLLKNKGMNALNLLFCFCYNFIWDNFGLIASLFSLFISLFFLFKPRFKTQIYICNHSKKEEGTRLNFKIWNNNIFHNNIINIKCEITAFKSDDNETVKTLTLKKENIICLRKGHDYVFYTTGDFSVIQKKYDKILVRIATLNFIGVQKVKKDLLFTKAEIDNKIEQNY